MNHCIRCLVSAIVLAGLVVSVSKGQQAADPFAEAARYAAGQPRKVLTGIEAEIRAAKKDQQPDLEAKLLKLIQSADSTIDGKAWACRQLRYIGSENSVETLAALLGSKDLAPVARQALLTMPGRNVNKALRDAISKTDGSLKAGLIQTIGARRDEDAIKLLAVESASKDALVAESAIAAMGNIGSYKAYKMLKTVKAPDSLKVCLASALLKCADQLVLTGKKKDAFAVYNEVLSANDAAFIKAAALRGVLVTNPKHALTTAESLLKSDSAMLRRISAASLCEYGDERQIMALFSKLPSLPVDTQVVLISCVKGKAVLPVICEAVAGSDQDVSVAAVTAVGRLGDESAVQLLLKVSAGQKGPLQAAARNSLQTLADKRAGAVLLLNAKSGDSAIRVEAINALKARAEVSAKADMFALLADGDNNVRAAAYGAIGQLAGAEDINELIKMFKSAGAENASIAERTLTDVCRRLPDADATASAVITAMIGSNPKEKVSLLRVIGQIKSGKAVEVLMAHIGDPDADIKDAAIRGMAGWPDASQIATVMEISQKAENQIHKIIALRGAIRMIGLPSARSAEQTVKLLSDAMKLASSPDDRKLVLAQLAGIKHEGALDLALQAVAYGDVNAEAAAAVKKIASELGDKNEAATAALKKINESGAKEGGK